MWIFFEKQDNWLQNFKHPTKIYKPNVMEIEKHYNLIMKF
jgi:hypothetical protein